MRTISLRPTLYGDQAEFGSPRWLAAIESQQTESFYGRKPRQVRRREEREVLKDNSSRATKREERLIRDTARLTIAAELLLGDIDQFARQASDKKFDSQIPTPRTYEEAVNDPVYGPKWREAIHVEIGALIQFGTWRYVKRPKDHSVVTFK
jgi:hypothetical protein